jgi:GT2 family glycosyltransferase
VNNTTDVGRITKWGRVVINRTSSLKTETEWASGGNCSFRKSIIQEVGGFDELFLGNAIFEDADFSFRVRKHGLKIIHDPEAVIWHLAASRGGCDTRALDEVNFYYWFLRNKSRFFKKNFPVYYIPLLLAMNISRAIKVGLLDGRSGHHFHKLIIATIDGLESA